MDEVEPERRSIFLRGAVFLANAFLILFAVAAVVSAVDDALLQVSEDAPFFLVELGLALALLAFLVITIVLVIFVPHLPKIVLLPPAAALVWNLAGAPPFVWSYDDHASMVPIDIVMLLVSALSFAICRLTTGQWLLSASQLPHKSHLVIRTLLVAPVFLVVVFVSLAGVVLVGLGGLIEEETGGYLRFTMQGVEVRETVMRKGDKTVHLFATVHLAEPRFYRELYASVPPGAVILAEGISDRNGLLTNGLRYNNAAHALGLESQDIFERLLREGQENDGAKPQPGKPASKTDAPPPAPKPRGPDIVRADVDASDFSPTTIKFLQRVGDFYASATMDEAMAKISKFGEDFTDADLEQVMDDILHKRNLHVLGELDKQLLTHQVVFIPWGAEHMKELEPALKERGFTIVSSRYVLIAKYETIFSGLTR